jgi:hypothetical protein
VLRRAIFAYGVLYLVGAVVLFSLLHVSIWPVLYLVVNGGVILGGLIFERRRYRPALSSGRPAWEWEETGERFLDPSSGQMMAVRYNAATGERDYIPAGPTPPKRVKGRGGRGG